MIAGVVVGDLISTEPRIGSIVIGAVAVPELVIVTAGYVLPPSMMTVSPATAALIPSCSEQYGAAAVPAPESVHAVMPLSM